MSICVERVIARIFVVVALMLVTACASRNIPNTLRFNRAETVFAPGGVSSKATWRPVALPARWPAQTSPRWLRIRFDNADFGGAKIALFSDRIREHYEIYLNGIDIQRSNADASDRSFDWHRPLFVPLSKKLLRPGANIVTFKVTADGGRAVAFGSLRIGPDRELRTLFRGRQFVTVTAPEIATGVIALLSIGSLLFWLMRPRESVFGWLALLGATWSFWNLQYFIDSVPFDDALFWALNADALFALTWAAFAFAATFLGVPHRRRFLSITALACLFAIACRHLSLMLGWNPLPSYLLVLPLALATLWVLGAACWRHPRVENFIMLGAVIISTIFGFHDLAIVGLGLTGVDFQLEPFGGLVLFLAFGFALGRRVLVALATVEDVNLILADRVREATNQLQLSENERRRLEVANAVDGERERMMREIHDGIGSNLITALAVAKRDGQSANTIATLKRSIQDLRIGVDSLEPVNGDVVMLLASLRHRVERELGDAGLLFVWGTMSAPPLQWLDAVGALHILRILQEAISNILTHAEASLVEVDCAASEHGGRPGVLVSIADNGRGFEFDGTDGRGLLNMAARAEALNALFSYESTKGAGTKLFLWLPLAIADRP